MMSKKLLKNGKKILASCLLGGALAMGLGYVTPQSAYAWPVVDIGHGNGRCSWYVDLGSIKSYGNETTVMVGYDNEYCNEGSRRYHFSYYGDAWHYKYDSWTGKGDYTPGYHWGLVSDNQMANDVLYVVNN